MILCDMTDLDWLPMACKLVQETSARSVMQFTSLPRWESSPLPSENPKFTADIVIILGVLERIEDERIPYTLNILYNLMNKVAVVGGSCAGHVTPDCWYERLSVKGRVEVLTSSESEFLALWWKEDSP